jgi:hypothetical protein
MGTELQTVLDVPADYLHLTDWSRCAGAVG